MEAGVKAKAIGLRVLIAIAVLAGLFVLVGSMVAVWSSEESLQSLSSKVRTRL